MNENDLILHQYDASPFTQKTLRMLGIKGADWFSVETPMILPKPDLIALTGGYRGTPVLQIGADVYIDNRRIATELESRIPAPPVSRRRSRLATGFDQVVRCLFSGRPAYGHCTAKQTVATGV